MTIVDFFIHGMSANDFFYMLFYIGPLLGSDGNLFTNQTACNVVAFGSFSFGGTSLMLLFFLAYSRYRLFKFDSGSYGKERSERYGVLVQWF